MPDLSTSPLLAFRNRHLLTQEQAADLVKIAPSTWRQIEREWRGRRPTASLLAHLATLDELAALKAKTHRRYYGQDDEG